MLLEIESEWRETGIYCPHCDGTWMTYSDGKSRPQCGNPDCLEHLTDEQILDWLITAPEYRKGGAEREIERLQKYKTLVSDYLQDAERVYTQPPEIVVRWFLAYAYNFRKLKGGEE